MTVARTMSRNVFSNWMNLAVNLIVGFFMLPFMIRTLGDSVYGVWTWIVALVGYGSLLDFGVRSSIVKYVAQHDASGESERLSALFATALWLYVGIAATVIVGSIGVAVWLSQLVNVPAGLTQEARLAMLVAGINLALKFPVAVFEGFITGRQRYEVSNGVAIVGTLLRTALIVVVLSNGGQLVALAAVGLGIDLLASAALVVFCFRMFPGVPGSNWRPNAAVCRQLYLFGTWSMAITVASRLLYESDAIIIGAVLPAAMITHYAVANNLVRYVRQLAYGFGNVFTPASSSMSASSEQARLRQLVLMGTRWGMFVVVPSMSLLVIFGTDLIALWVSPRIAEQSGEILRVLALSQTLAMGQFSAGAILYGLNRHRYLAYVLLGQAAVKLVLSINLMPGYGLLGVALGTAIPELVASIFLVPWLVTASVGLALKEYWRVGIVPALACAVPASGIGLALREIFPPTGWALLILESAVVSGIFVATAWRWFLDMEQRRVVLSAIRSGLSRSNQR